MTTFIEKVKQWFNFISVTFSASSHTILYFCLKRALLIIMRILIPTETLLSSSKLPTAGKEWSENISIQLNVHWAYNTDVWKWCGPVSWCQVRSGSSTACHVSCDLTTVMNLRVHRHVSHHFSHHLSFRVPYFHDTFWQTWFTWTGSHFPSNSSALHCDPGLRKRFQTFQKLKLNKATKHLKWGWRLQSMHAARENRRREVFHKIRTFYSTNQIPSAYGDEELKQRTTVQLKMDLYITCTPSINGTVMWAKNISTFHQFLAIKNSWSRGSSSQPLPCKTLVWGLLLNDHGQNSTAQCVKGKDPKVK